MAGAETLRWCDEYERANDDAQCRADEELLEDYEDTLSKLSEAVDNWMQSKLARPAAFRDELNKILDIAGKPR